MAVIELDLDAGLSEFADGTYDLVVVSQTLQASATPTGCFARSAGLPAAGSCRCPTSGSGSTAPSLLLRGRMPVSAELPHPWYDTPNIHLATLADLEDLFEHRGCRSASGAARPTGTCRAGGARVGAPPT